MNHNSVKDLVKMFLIFLRIGCFTFGGGFAMIPLIQREIIKKEWIEESELIDIIAISQTIPGAIAVNIALFIGYKIAKIKGAIIACLGVIIPSFVIILLLATIFTQVQDHEIVEQVFKGVYPAIVALILYAGIKLAKVSIIDWFSLLIFIGSFFILILTDVLPIILILVAAILGLLMYHVRPNLVKKLREMSDR